jgi:hypothetical protein
VGTRVLAPLAEADAAALVDATAAISPAVRASVVRRAAGVPLFLVGLARAAGDRTGGKVPWHLRLAVRRELAALPGPVLGLLTGMALVATTVPAERLVTDDLPADRLLEYLDMAVQVGILDETRRGFRFRYPLVREVICEGIGPARRTLWRSLSRGSADPGE